jgi:hypothetical protein
MGLSGRPLFCLEETVMGDDGRRFIIYPHCEDPRMDEEGNIISDGVTGRISADNCYLTAYPKWPDDNDLRPEDLNVGDCIMCVEYRLSGSYGIYDIYRVS